MLSPQICCSIRPDRRGALPQSELEFLFACVSIRGIAGGFHEGFRQRLAKRDRRRFSGEQKVSIVKQHLVDGIAVSDLCDKHQILPPQFYQWQKQLFEGGAVALERMTSGKSNQYRCIEQLQAKIWTKNEVVAELMKEDVKAKKECGEL